jgi:hypothetical protein
VVIVHAAVAAGLAADRSLTYAENHAAAIVAHR